MSNKRILSLLTILIWAAGSGNNVFPATVSNTNDSGPGSLRDAIAITPAGGTVNFALSGCPCTVVLTSGQLVIDKNLAIVGQGSGLTTVSGNNTWRVFFVNQATAVAIESLTVANGFRTWGDEGAGIRAIGNQVVVGKDLIPSLALTLKNVRISENLATVAGGISTIATMLTIENSVISGNRANLLAGGLRVESHSRLRLVDSTVAANTASFAPALDVQNYCRAELENVTIESNVGPGGFVIQSVLSTMSITNSTISVNSAAGIASSSPDYGDAPTAPALLKITNSTIWGNLVTGIRTDSEGPCCPAETTIRNSIIAGNGTDVSSLLGGKYFSEGYNLIGNAGLIVAFNQPGDQAGTASLPLDPKLGPLAFYGGLTKTHNLRPDSPAIDRGKAFGSIIDQRGSGRSIDNPDIANASGGDGTDIGAYEMQFPLTGLAAVSGRVLTTGGLPLRRGFVTLTDANHNARFAAINQFGYYRFFDIPLGQSFAVDVNAKPYRMNPKLLFVSDALIGFDLTPNRE